MSSAEALVIVPGYTPLQARKPIRLHPQAKKRLERAVEVAGRLGIPRILVTGGAVHPFGTPFTEAVEMAEELGRMGWPVGSTIIEDRARHSTTNLRNAGRIMIAKGWLTARIITDPLQNFYFGVPVLSTFLVRYRRGLGHEPGRLAWISPWESVFEPNPSVVVPGPDPLDP